MLFVVLVKMIRAILVVNFEMGYPFITKMVQIWFIDTGWGNYPICVRDYFMCYICTSFHHLLHDWILNSVHYNSLSNQFGPSKRAETSNFLLNDN